MAIDRFRSEYVDKGQINRLDKVTVIDVDATPFSSEANKKTNVKDLHKKEIFDIDANTTITASQGQIFFNSTKATGTHDFTLNTTSLQVGDTIWIKKSGACDSISLIAGSGVTINTVQSATEIGDLLIITKIATAVFSCVKIPAEILSAVGSGISYESGILKLGVTPLDRQTPLYLNGFNFAIQNAETLPSGLHALTTFAPGYTEFKFIDTTGTIKRKEFKLDENSLTFRDDVNEFGIKYHGTYNGSSDPLWIPYWAFVETKLGEKIGTASNGVTKTGTDIKLGGTQPLAENTTILGDATGNYDFAIGKSTNFGLAGTRIKNFIVKLKEKALWGIHEAGFYHYFNWGASGLEINGDVSGVRSYVFKIGEETSLAHSSSVTGDGYHIYANKDEFYLQSTKDGETKEIWGESGVNDNGIIITDTNEVGLVNAADYTAKQLLNDRAITDVGGIKQLIATIPTNISREVATYADLPSDAVDKEQVYVVDASLDPTVTSGWAIYQSVGDKPAGSWIKLMEQESLDIDISLKADTTYVNAEILKQNPAIGIFVTATTADSGATYTGTTTTTLATFPKMFAIRGVALSQLTENSTINIAGTGAIKLKDSNGNAINGALLNNKDYTCYYDNIGDGTTHEYRLLRPLHGLLPDGSFWIKTVFNLLITFSGTAISGGSFDEVSLGTGSKYTHLAMIKSHASNANSGARTNYSGDKALYPNFMREYIFHIPSVACTTRSARFGLMRPTYLPGTPPYGVWFDISNLTLSCSCTSVPSTTTHATTYTLALNTTYKALIEVNTALTSVNFKLFVAGNSTPVLDNNITTNIPTDDVLIDIMMAIASEGASKEIIGFASWGAGDRNGYNKIG